MLAGTFLGRTMSRAAGTKALPPGHVILRGACTYDGGGMGKRATLTLSVNDQQAGEARMAQTHPLTLGLGGALDVGLDSGAPADETYQAQAPFPSPQASTAWPFG